MLTSKTATSFCLAAGILASTLGGAMAAEVGEAPDLFVTQCRFKTGEKAVLMNGFGQNSFALDIRRGETVSDSSTITIQGGSITEIETNGGIGKRTAVRELFEVLLKTPFTFAKKSELPIVLKRQNVAGCPIRYPFSP